MKTLRASRQWAIGSTVIFGLAQLWAAYHLSSRLDGHSQAGEGMRWLVIGAALCLVAGEVLTAASGARDK